MEERPGRSFEEISVQRINVVDENGTIRLVVSNKDRSPDWVFEGERFARPKAAGMIFYNEAGVECGGLKFGGTRGDSIEAGASLTFDRYENDQVIGIIYDESGGRMGYGLLIWDRPVGLGMHRKYAAAQDLKAGAEKEAALREIEKAMNQGAFGRQRMFVGRSGSGDVKVSMADGKGQERIRMVVDTEGSPRIEFLDAEGNVTYRLPPE